MRTRTPALDAIARDVRRRERDAEPEWFTAQKGRVEERRQKAKSEEARADQRLQRVKDLKRDAKKIGVSVYPGWDSSAEDLSKKAKAAWGLAGQNADDRVKFEQWGATAERDSADADGRVQSLERTVQEYKSRS